MPVYEISAVNRYIGLSSDTKPTPDFYGSIFFETDTRLTHICYDGVNWAQYVDEDNPGAMQTSTNPAANAAVTVAIIDAYSGVIILQNDGTPANQTLASPTITTAGKIFTVVNNDTSVDNETVIANSVSFTVTPGEAQSFIWDGSAWGPIDIGITAIPVTVPQGGTGLSTITDHGIMLGSGTGAVTPMAVLDTGALITGVTGADPTSVSPNITTTKKFLTETGTGAVGATPVFDTIISADLTTALTTAPKITSSDAINTAYATVASHATTSAIWAAAGNVINFTGAQTITDFPAAPQAGAQRLLICAGAAVFTHAGNITVQGAATYTAAAGTVVLVTALTTTTFRVDPIGVTRVKFPGGANDDGIVFGNLGTATKGIDLSGSGLSGGGDYWFYGSANNYWAADGTAAIQSTLAVGTFYGNIQPATVIYGPNGGVLPLALQNASNTMNAVLVASANYFIGSLTACTSNGTTTITKTTHGLTLAAGELVHITGATTAADKGFYRIISSGVSTIVVDRALAGSDTDVALTIYKDVICIFATDGTNGQRIMNYSAQNKPLQIGGDVLAATGHSLTGEDVLIGGDLEVNGNTFFDGTVGIHGTTGGLTRKVAETTGTPAGTTTYFDIAVSVPSGARLLGCQLRVDTALTDGETWGAAYVTGSTTTLAAAGRAVAQNTKIDKLHVDEIATNTVNVRITRDAGNFTNAAGVIRAIVYYETLDTMASL